MAVEIEAKMTVDSFEPVRAKLRGAGAAGPVEHFELNTFFDTEDRSLLAADEGLRLRRDRDVAAGGEKHVITYKGPRQPGPLKNREEVEVDVSDSTAAVQLLERLGYLRTLSFEKRRESWKLDNCKVELDEVPHLGRFVEVEGPDEPSVMRVREKLGLAHRPIVKSSYIALLMSHLQERGLATKTVTFEGPSRGS
jgi:predicted adenylyl cyclase CyaB